MSDEFKIHASVQNLFKTIKATKSANAEKLTDQLKSHLNDPSVATQVRVHQAVRSLQESAEFPHFFNQQYENVSTRIQETRPMNNFLLVLQGLKRNQNSLRILKRHSKRDDATKFLLDDISKDIAKTDVPNFSPQLLSPQVNYTQEEIALLTEQLAKKTTVGKGATHVTVGGLPVSSPHTLAHGQSHGQSQGHDIYSTPPAQAPHLEKPILGLRKSNELKNKNLSQHDTSQHEANHKIFIPDWCKTRSFLNDDLIPNPLDHLTSSGLESKLGNLPLETQEFELISDLLNMFIGLTGTWIKVRYDENDPKKRIYSIDDSAEPGLRTAAQKLLPLASAYLQVSYFVNNYAWLPEAGQTLNALGAAMRRALNDYTLKINSIYNLHLHSNDMAATAISQITLQRLHAGVTGPDGVFRRMELLANVAKILETGGQKGAAVLSWLQKRASKTGDELVESLYNNLLNLASMPFYETLDNWITKGEISNSNVVDGISEGKKYTLAKSEFMINEIPYFNQDKLSTVYNDQFWERRFNLVESKCPDSMVEYKEKILKTGKYVKVINECLSKIPKPNGTYNVWVPPKLTSPHNNSNISIYAEIEEYYKASSQKLLQILIEDHHLREHLSAVKRYMLFGDCGSDTMLQLFDIAEKELFSPYAKSNDNTLMINKINRLLELSLRSSIGSKDQLNEFVTAEFKETDYITDLAQVLARNTSVETDFSKYFESISNATDGTSLNQGQKSPNSSNNKPKLKFIDIFSLNWSAEWPNNIVLSKKTLTHYQLLFRHLLYCKIVENKLTSVWSRVSEYSKSFETKYYKSVVWLSKNQSHHQHQPTAIFGKSKSSSFDTSGASNKNDKNLKSLSTSNSSTVLGSNVNGCYWLESDDPKLLKIKKLKLNFRLHLQLVCQIRSMMMNFVTNFQYYMYSEVIEPNWQVFKSKLKQVSDLDQVLEFQQDFLENCMKDCLLSDFALLSVMGKLMENCTKFCETIEKEIIPVGKKILDFENKVLLQARAPGAQVPGQSQALLEETGNLESLGLSFGSTGFEESTLLSDGQLKIKLLSLKANFIKDSQGLVDELAKKRCNTLEHALVGLAVKLNYNYFYG